VYPSNLPSDLTHHNTFCPLSRQLSGLAKGEPKHHNTKTPTARQNLQAKEGQKPKTAPTAPLATFRFYISPFYILNSYPPPNRSKNTPFLDCATDNSFPFFNTTVPPFPLMYRCTKDKFTSVDR